MKNPWNRATIAPRIHRSFSAQTEKREQARANIMSDLAVFEANGGIIEQIAIRIGPIVPTKYPKSL